MAATEGKSDIGLIGLAVMGENLVLNMANHGFRVSVWNRTVSKVGNFVKGRAKGKSIVGCQTVEEFCSTLASPRRIMIMVRAGWPVDSTIEKLIPHLSKGDIIIDGGNSNFEDSNRRTKELEEQGFLFIGTGVSGGEEGALKGPSIMPGGSHAAWAHVKPIFQAIAAKVSDGSPCCDWVGDAGAGHYVKMVHNGVEYGDMQLICEAYHLMRSYLGLTNEDIHKELEGWNKRNLDSYLIEITRDIFAKKEEPGAGPNAYVVDNIVDRAGQKGTGKWTTISALDIGVPVTLIGEAVFARCLSAQKEERVEASKVLTGPAGVTTCPLDSSGGNLSNVAEYKAQFLADLENAVFAAKIVSYAQGFVLLRAAAKEHNWTLNYGAIALMWRGGCIIRSNFLGNIKEAFDNNAGLSNLLLDPYFAEKVLSAQEGWRRVCSVAVLNGIPAPAITSALAYFDGYRTARLPANLLQAQRDYFGAHTYQRINQPKDQYFHTNWTGEGGSTSASSYNA